jgi:hypothetical protein
MKSSALNRKKIQCHIIWGTKESWTSREGWEEHRVLGRQPFRKRLKTVREHPRPMCSRTLPSNGFLNDQTCKQIT